MVLSLCWIQSSIGSQCCVNFFYAIAARDVKKTTTNTSDKVSDKVDSTAHDIQGAAGDVKANTQEATQSVKDTISDTSDGIKANLQNVSSLLYENSWAGQN